MKKTLLAASMLAASSALLIGCQTEREINIQKDTADLVLHSGAIYTVELDNPWAEAIAIKDGKIAFVGDTKQAKSYIGEHTEVVDLDDKFVVPGFQDAHIHPLEGASLETFLGCRMEDIGEDRNPEHWIDFLKKCNDVETPHGWVLGGGHDMVDLLTLGRMPKEVLDDAFPDRPAAFMEKSSHSMWVNSKALEVTGITRDTPDPQGGIIYKDIRTGEPNGILSDSAGDELLHKALKKNPALQKARYEALLIGQDLMAENGITSATNARVYWERGNLEPWLEAEKADDLKIRNVMALWAYPHMDDDKQLAQLKSMYRDDRESKLRLSQIKFYSDGTVSNNSAAVLVPYAKLIHPHSHPMGLNYFTEERMAKYIAELEVVGFDAHIHALGDRGVRESLNAIEYARQANPGYQGDRRHQLTHVTVLDEQDMTRFKESGVIANFQINFDPEFMKLAASDPIKSETGDPWFEMIANSDAKVMAVLPTYEAGAKVVLSSDWDVSEMYPLYSVENLAKMYEGKLPKDDLLAIAMQAYTLNAAYALKQEDMTGSLKTGKYADFVILDQNIFTVPLEAVDETQVLATYVGGKAVYRSE
ncbi:amidohydrolase [Maricurvus nonylphenolicus]|uniref:amidohydrolase n=1 Tax=Maricurvus nonylphenolicus TaxID=1008307 RepID=UPI0036F43E21